VICVILLTAAVHAEEPMITESVHSFAHLRWRPLALAVAAETGSMVALGLMERRILIMGGLRLPVSRAVAIAHASNALSALAGWALTLSGIASNAAFVLIVSIGAIVSGNIVGVAAGAAGILLTILAVAVAVIAIRRHRSATG
jgi:hypothetical protein